MILALLPMRTNVSTRYIPVKPIIPVHANYHLIKGSNRATIPGIPFERHT